MILNRKKIIIRTELGEDLEIIMLEMSVEGQEERVRGRHEGSQNAVDLMRVGGTSSYLVFVSLTVLLNLVGLNPKYRWSTT